MERLEGRTLTEADMHKGDTDLLEKVAAMLAKLHQLERPLVFEAEPMLWRMMDRMLDAAARKPELWASGVPAMDVISQEVRKVQAAVQKLDLRVVLCHGDFKPSNVVQTRLDGEIKFIDHELAGPNYRAFDLMKIFRTGGKSSDSSMRHFLREYMRCSGPDPSDEDVDALMRETKLFECLTWLEALCFFLALPQFRPAQASRWNDLALDRWEKYEDTKHMLLGKDAWSSCSTEARRHRLWAAAAAFMPA
jgi:thiamine kinase-like enzyme